MIVRFDDTNPDKENQDFVDAILEDIASMGIQFDKLTYTSDSFDAIIAMGEKLLRDGNMYIDDTPVDKLREERMVGTESKCRSNTVEQNLALWKEMLAGSERGLQCCARFKMDMSELNKALRDPVAFRCNLTPHHRTGTKYKMYPTYDCACPFVDAFEGVTHALRTSEYRDREAQYIWIQKLMGVRKVTLFHSSSQNISKKEEEIF